MKRKRNEILHSYILPVCSSYSLSNIWVTHFAIKELWKIYNKIQNNTWAEVHMLFMKQTSHDLFTLQKHTSSSSLPSFSPHCSAGEPAVTWLTKIPVRFPPTIVISSARLWLALLCFDKVGGLEDGEQGGILRDSKNWQEKFRMLWHVYYTNIQFILQI